MPIQAISELRLPRHNKMNPIGQPMMKRKIQLLNAQMWLVTPSQSDDAFWFIACANTNADSVAGRKARNDPLLTKCAC